MDLRLPAVRGRGLALMVIVCALLTGGCARQAAGSGPPSSGRAAGQPRTTTVTAADAGRTVTLRVGDQLEVALGMARQTGDEWRLISYPEQLLSLLPAPAGHYRFAATAPGRGALRANPTLVCAPTDNPSPLLCPPRDARTGTAQRRPHVRFTLTVHVSR